MNLPDGVRVTDLPGFREEDAEYENAVAELTEELQYVIRHYRSEYSCLDDDTVKEVLLDLLPSRSSVLTDWQVEAAIQKIIEREVEWLEKHQQKERTIFKTARRLSGSWLFGIGMLARNLLRDPSRIEESIESARTTVKSMTWQGPAA